MHEPELEQLVAGATKAYMRDMFRLDTATFKTTDDRAWVLVARRLFADAGKLTPIKTGQRIGEWPVRSLQSDRPNCSNSGMKPCIRR